MILPKLAQAYDRLVEAGRIDTPFLVSQEIHLVVVIDRDGVPQRIETTYTEAGAGQVRGKRHLAPRPPKGKSGKNPPSSLLYERLDYVLGMPFGLKDDLPAPARMAAEEKAQAAQRRFAAAIADLPEAVRQDEGVSAALKFAMNPALGELAAHPGLAKLVRSPIGGKVTLRMEGDCGPDGSPRLIFERQAVREYCRRQFEAVPTDALPERRCIITGERRPAVRLHRMIPGLRSSSGNAGKPAALVSYNNAAFESWGLDGSENTGISVEGERAYTGALEWLLANSRAHIGSVTFVAWPDDLGAQEAAPAVDQAVAAVLGIGADEQSRVSFDAAQALEAIRAPLTGLLQTDDRTYNVLGLTAAMARAVVRFWHTAPASVFATSVSRHIQDMGAAPGQRVLSAWQIISALERDPYKPALPPALGAEIVAAAMTGRAYPSRMLHAAVERVLRGCPRKEDNGAYRESARIRCIRACIVRADRLAGRQESLGMALDRENPNVPYRLGRLFAVYESIQQASEPQVNTTIRDTLFNSAARMPAKVFSAVSARSVHHLAKVRKHRPGLAFWFDGQVQEVLSGVAPEGLPVRLSPDDTARFLVGYHHQAMAMREKKPEAATDGEGTTRPADDNQQEPEA